MIIFSLFIEEQTLHESFFEFKYEEMNIQNTVVLFSKISKVFLEVIENDEVVIRKEGQKEDPEVIIGWK